MGWATLLMQKLRAGETVRCRPRGHSMRPHIESGQLCTIEPVLELALLQVGDIVLCKVHGHEYLHFIKAIDGERFQIGNARNGINGWIGKHGIFGRLIAVG
jgi:hypothetical protein